MPSHPGYTFSSGPPLNKDFRIEDIARIVDKLAVGLGFGDGYVVQGGDIGSKVSRILGAVHPSCKGVYFDNPGIGTRNSPAVHRKSLSANADEITFFSQL